jgi:dephospho-CoA kinase
MLVVGLTGGIASGKSTVAGFFREWGAEVLNADEIGHQVILPGKKAWRQLVEAFGEGILLPHGEVDREMLGRIVFGDPVARERLNAIVHPPLVAELEDRIRALRRQGVKGIVVIDAALLPLWSVMSLVERLVVVQADTTGQVDRLVREKGLPPEEATRRVASQQPVQERLRRKDIVIRNDGDLSDLRAAARLAWEEIVQSQH